MDIMADDYTCKRCGYVASCNSNMIKHLKRKKACRPILEDIPIDELLKDTYKRSYTEDDIQCAFCKKYVGSTSALSRHKKICKKNPNLAVSIHDVIDEKINEKMKSLMNIIEQQKQEIQTLKEASTSTTNYVQSQNTNNGTINNITINALGKEDISYLTQHPRFGDFMVKCIKDKIDGLCQFIVRKHFDPNHPENHNIRKLNRKDEFINCYDGRKWNPRFSEDVLRDIFINIQTDFANFVDEAITDDGKIKKVWLDNFMKQVGAPLEWDLSTGDYEFSEEIDDEIKETCRNKIYKLACEYIYRHSKEVPS